ncbi:nitrilotriacetate monooxygenase [Bordetella genomosp. 10]|uniref:Nitrilotriacetate monooxygenase n=1 Tax=Bordetella genomosp. 10 TaxID=1416804 RepID=A0A261SK41_9BORD|nr:LLM class flavin-dependent oxidoreductase [Bordetella genomosp. 10]OZI37120.1 nitrilotriacetate monooxygenase [Bordetella genomosp. 10]
MSLKQEMKRQIKLGLFVLHAGYHQGGWRLPQARSGGEDVGLMREIAQSAEAAKFDFIFFPDVPGSDATSTPSVVSRFEPLTLLSALSGVTRRIGLAATASTTYHEPMNLARMFASLDHLSGGRAAWNVVTTLSKEAAGNFGGQAQVPHAQRYERATEFVQVVRGLWDSWDEGAFPRDKESGVYFDATKMRRLDHQGRHFSVRGPLNLNRPPQGYPITIVAGASGPGLDLAARYADVSFGAQYDLDTAREHYGEVKRRAQAAGRNPDHVLVMPGVVPIVGATEEEAAGKFDAMQQYVAIEEAIPLLSFFIGHDISGLPLDEPLPPTLGESEAMKSRTTLLLDLAHRKNMTLRQLAMSVAAARGHLLLVGTAATIADTLQEWFESRAADGFNILPPYFPGGLDDFSAGVLPVLRARGLFRTEYEGSTLRENLGLPVPPSQYVKE